MSLEWVPCIYYPLYFRKNTEGVKALMDSNSEVNVMIPAYVSRLGLQARYTNVRAQKIDDSTLQTFGMVLASFQIKDKLRRAQFF